MDRRRLGGDGVAAVRRERDEREGCVREVKSELVRDCERETLKVRRRAGERVRENDRESERARE